MTIVASWPNGINPDNKHVRIFIIRSSSVITMDCQKFLDLVFYKTTCHKWYFFLLELHRYPDLAPEKEIILYPYCIFSLLNHTSFEASKRICLKSGTLFAHKMSRPKNWNIFSLKITSWKNIITCHCNVYI